jgi:(1->4)-alpha-D-glucan 1-alpha-D-glucosylmutase
MTVPRSTLRLQLHRDFTFDDAARQVDYMAALGISHAYLSPITTATRGSTHSYDTVDYTRVNPELGGEEGLQRLVAALRAHEMGVIVDVVPNHMGVGGSENGWWMDILEWGRHAAHARYFDVDWHSPDPALRGKVLAPFLGAAYGEELQRGKIKLTFDAHEGRFKVEYYSHTFPICPVDYAPLLRESAPELAQRFAGLVTQPEDHPRADEARAALKEFAASGSGQKAIAAVLDTHCADNATGRDRLHRLLERQHYRLAWWRTAADEVNWRRFFDVSTLGGMRVERPEVFEASHALIFRLFTQGLIDGVRIDHVDGLAEPREYCQRLRARLEELAVHRPQELQSPRTYFVVEKILARGESVREDWPIDGTTGYEFMNDVGALLHDPRGAEPLAESWAQLSGRPAEFAVEADTARRKILSENLSAELDRVARALHKIARDTPLTRDFTFSSLRRVVAELVVQFPVYRIYPLGGERTEEDERFFSQAYEGAKAVLSPADLVILDQVTQWLGGKIDEETYENPRERERGRNRASASASASASGSASAMQNLQLNPAGSNSSGSHRRNAQTLFSQLTSPVAAKAIEDTACYRYGRLISRNEVGADPGEFALSVAAFHEGNSTRAQRFPNAMLTTATHDHKRGEDVRARIAGLSEIAGDWSATLKNWSTLNAPHRRAMNGDWAPGAAAESMLYQTLVGCWPPTLSPDDAAGVKELAERVSAWQLKALREAKLRTSWFAPDEAYENACRDFLFDILAPQRRDGFLGALPAFVERVARTGAINSFQQTLLRLTSPGVPDLYQGTELWDFSLVDPDNRRPVDFEQRREWLSAGEAAGAPSEQLKNWRDGRVKLGIVRRALALRTHAPDLFGQGAYLPLKVEGAHADSVIAFARHTGSAYAVVIATRLATSLLTDTDLPLVDARQWGDTAVLLPEALASRALFDWLSPNAPQADGERLFMRDALALMPVALLMEEGVPKV